MYKIVENEDGSTGVYSSKTGELICSVNSKKNPVGIGHPIRRTDNLEVAPTTVQMGLACKKLSIGQKCSNALGSADSMKTAISPIMKEEYEDDDSSLGEFPPLPSDDQDSTIGDFSDECISQEEFLQCLGIVSSQKLEQNSYEDLRQEFPLRVISKTVPESTCSAELQVKFLENVEICSPLGIRILQSSPHHELDETGVMSCISKCERYCQFSVSSVYYGNVPQLRNRELLIKYPVTYRPLKTWRADGTFVYSFTKKQRLERVKILKTGLNKRGRRLKRLCQEVSVNVTRLSPKEIKSWLKRKTTPHSAVYTANYFHNLNTVNGMRSSLKAAAGPFNNGSASLKPPLSLVLMKNISVKSKHHTSELVNSFTGYGPVKSGFSTIKTGPVKLYLQNGKPRLATPLKVQHSFTFNNSLDDNGDIEILYIKRPSVKSQQSVVTYFRNAHKSSDTVKNCSVPLQDVSKQIDKVGGKCFVKGTAIKACGMKSENKGPQPNSILMNNNFIKANCITSNLLDHAYHRNPLVNSTRPTSRAPGRNSVVVSMKNGVANEPHQDRENIRKIAIPRVAVSLPRNKRCNSLLAKKVDAPRLPGVEYSRTVPSVIAHNRNSVRFRSLKLSPMPLPVKVPQRTNSVAERPNVKQLKKNIQVIDITEDNPREILSPVKNKPNALKWMFRCYGCGFRSMFFSKLDFDDAISKHMTQYHSVTEPDSFLNSFLDTEESAIVTEAFPGYKNRGAQ